MNRQVVVYRCYRATPHATRWPAHIDSMEDSAGSRLCWQQGRNTASPATGVTCIPHQLPPHAPPQVVGALNVAKMDKLQNLDALAQLTQIQGDLVVWSNSELTSIEGLGPVTTLFGNLWVDANPKLTSLRGLEVGRV